jgi:hypothetical protein
VDREGGVVDRRHGGRQTRPAGVVTILVPPAVFQEVRAVFNPPVLADVLQEVVGVDLLRIEATDVVSRVVQRDLTACGA